MYLLNNKALEFDVMGWVILAVIGLVIIIGLIVVFMNSSNNLINILPF